MLMEPMTGKMWRRTKINTEHPAVHVSCMWKGSVSGASAALALSSSSVERRRIRFRGPRWLDCRNSSKDFARPWTVVGASKGSSSGVCSATVATDSHSLALFMVGDIGRGLVTPSSNTEPDASPSSSESSHSLASLGTNVAPRSNCRSAQGDRCSLPASSTVRKSESSRSAFGTPAAATNPPSRGARYETASFASDQGFRKSSPSRALAPAPCPGVTDRCRDGR
ncbi:hypothetical protein DFJ73DRAFT_811008 [Zopfochytrium polystomum]|nr:hypothetical protein DFJ73DRAFT_811008 [Zopfochytrium polystomum]